MALPQGAVGLSAVCDFLNGVINVEVEISPFYQIKSNQMD